MKTTISGVVGALLVTLSLAGATEKISIEQAGTGFEAAKLGDGVLIKDGVPSLLSFPCVEGKKTVTQKFLYPDTVYRLRSAYRTGSMDELELDVSVSFVNTRLALQEPTSSESLKQSFSAFESNINEVCGSHFVAAYQMGSRATVRIRYSATHPHGGKAAVILMEAAASSKVAGQVDEFRNNLAKTLASIRDQIISVEITASAPSPDLPHVAQADAKWIMQNLEDYADWIKDEKVTPIVLGYDFEQYSEVRDFLVSLRPRRF